MAAHGCAWLGIAEYDWSIAEYCGVLQNIAEYYSMEGWLSMDGWVAGCDCICHRAALWALQMQPTTLLPSDPSPSVPIGTERGERNRRQDMTLVCLHVIALSFDGAFTW
ncbi:hypothetical protein AB205_0051580 [Aquarana catesbeiana]|uniref:Uncharacterized protein n=1 Tax=Aquarana catesbeiana TaxID=8400 RepID=A0A2G9RJV4_AQUCT|nr:hypothetical protein AB205_0051580 [Aquarana catesbeiana]